MGKTAQSQEAPYGTFAGDDENFCNRCWQAANAQAERDQLKEQNKELVEALECIRQHTIGAAAFTNKEGLYATVTDRINGIEDIARAVLAKIT